MDSRKKLHDGYGLGHAVCIQKLLIAPWRCASDRSYRLWKGDLSGSLLFLATVSARPIAYAGALYCFGYANGPALSGWKVLFCRTGETIVANPFFSGLESVSWGGGFFRHGLFGVPQRVDRCWVWGGRGANGSGWANGTGAFHSCRCQPGYKGRAGVTEQNISGFKIVLRCIGI